MSEQEPTPSGHHGNFLYRLLRFWDLLLALTVAEAIVLFAFLALLDGKSPSSSSARDLGPVVSASDTFGGVLAFGIFPSVIIGTIYGLATNARSITWSVLARMVASVLIVVLGVFVAMAGSVYVVSSGDRGP